MEMIPKAMQEAFVGINMCGGAVTFAVLLRLFRAADLRWEMHPAQLFSIEAQSTFLDSRLDLFFRPNGVCRHRNGWRSKKRLPSEFVNSGCRYVVNFRCSLLVYVPFIDRVYSLETLPRRY